MLIYLLCRTTTVLLKFRILIWSGEGNHWTFRCQTKIHHCESKRVKILKKYAVITDFGHFQNFRLLMSYFLCGNGEIFEKNIFKLRTSKFQKLRRAMKTWYLLYCVNIVFEHEILNQIFRLPTKNFSLKCGA